MMIRLIFVTVVLVFLVFVSSAQALPPVETDLTIGGVVVIEPNGDPAMSLSEQVSLLLADIQPPGGQCLVDEALETGPTTNSFAMEFDLASCEGTILETLGAFGQFDMFIRPQELLKSSLEVSTQPGFFVEILQFTRSSPTSPIALVLENLGFPLPGGSNLRVTPRVTDGVGSVLFQGADVEASADGTGPVGGGSKFSFVLDPIPEDVGLQNVDRQFVLELAAVQGGVVQGVTAQLAHFPLTFATATGCMELLQFGPGGQATLPPVLASVGCAVLAPPPSCLEKTSNAIGAARDYQSATRVVTRECGRKLTTACDGALVDQVNAYQTLVEAQAQVDLVCLP